MKQILQSKTFTVILASVCGLLVAVALWRFLGVGRWWEVRSAIRDIANRSQTARARTALETLNDRAYVLAALEAAVEDDSWNIDGRIEILTTLSMLSQPRAVRRALDSRSVAAQRAACWLLWGDPDAKTRCGEIALAWLKDQGSEERWRAAHICRGLDLAEAQPVLLEIVGRDPTTDGERNLFLRALQSIKDPKPKELVERLLKMAGDPEIHADLRAIALDTLQKVKDGPRDQILALSIGLLEDATADRMLRMKAAVGLRDFPEDRSWQALETVLLSETGEDPILQRNCLYSLGMMTPEDPAVAKRYLDRLRQLLHDRRVYHHKYFAIRVDVATALAALNAREPMTLDIMCDYLVDEDKDDRQHLVAQEAWLTLWTLTGTKFEDTPQPELWERPPPAFPDARDAREFLFSRRRPGIKPEQSAVVAKIASDLARMQKARQVYQGLKGKILEQWRVEAEKAQPAEPKDDKGAGGPEKEGGAAAGPQKPN